MDNRFALLWNEAYTMLRIVVYTAEIQFRDLWDFPGIYMRSECL